MTLESLGRKVDNITEGIYDLIDQLNKQNNLTIFYFILIAITLTIAIIITEFFVIRYIQITNRQLTLHKKQIKELQNYLKQTENDDLSEKEQEILTLLRKNPSMIDETIYNLKK